jgi:DNA-binding transcriptional ArsR family regulator
MRKFTRIPKMIIFQRAGAPSYLVGTYCALADYAANDTGLCWPRMDTLASTLKISVRTVQRHLSALKELGLIEFVDRRRTARGRFSSWCYRLVLMASFNKPATTGHSWRPAKTPSNIPGTKRQKNTPLTPREKDSSLSGSRRSIKDGYEWLFST